MTKGVLFLGDSGSGKSRLALSLLNANGRLVSDDVVEIFRLENEIVGRAPGSNSIDGKKRKIREIKGLLEVKGVGIVDIGRVLGPSFVIDKSKIDLAIELVNEKELSKKTTFDDEDGMGICSNFCISIEKVQFLGVDIPKIYLDKEIDANRLIIVLTDFILGGSKQSTVLKKLLENHD